MQRINATGSLTPYLLQVGSEVYPISGDPQRGWHLADEELLDAAELGFRYQSVSELFFALVNLSLARAIPV